METARDFIEHFVHGASSINERPVAKRRKQDDEDFKPDADLKSTLIKKTCVLMGQFHKFYRDLELQGNKADPPLDKCGQETLLLSEKRNNMKYYALFRDFAWEDLQKILTSFQQFYKTCLSKSQNHLRALGVHVIIREILQYLPRSDVLNCRIVNKTWNQNAILQFYKQSDNYLSENYFCKVTDMKKFCIDVDVVNEESIFNRIEISLEENPLEDCTTFFNKVGHQVKCLKIDEYKGVQSELLLLEYQLKLRMAFQSCPNVETLVLWGLPNIVSNGEFVLTAHEIKTAPLFNVKTLDFYARKKLCPEFLEALFSLVPNVRICDLAFNPEQDCEKLASALNNLKLHALILNWIKVPAQKFWSNLHNLKLKELKMIILSEDTGEVEAYEAFFKSQSESLKELDLGFPEGKDIQNDHIKINLPSMKLLEDLRLDCTTSPFHELQSENFPSLRKLVMRNLDFISGFSLGDVFPSVQELVFEGDDVEDCGNSELLRRISSTFPNLKTLKNYCIHMGDEALEILFSFRNLECLMLNIYKTNLEKSISFVLSGFTTEEGASIAFQFIALNSPMLTAIEPPNPSLQNLKHLKRLKLEFKSLIKPPNRDEFMINELCTHFGLLGLPRLEELEFVGYFTIAPEAVTELSKYHFKVIISPSPDPESDTDTDTGTDSE